MTTRRPATMILALLSLLALSMVLRYPAPVTAQGQRANPAVPHQQPLPPAVLALDTNGEPTPVSQNNPVPVHMPTPIPITTSAPLVVNDGGLVIESTGAYTFVFPNEVTLPALGGKVSSVEVNVTRLAGKWVSASYFGSAIDGKRPTITMVFNTQQLLAIEARR